MRPVRTPRPSPRALRRAALGLAGLGVAGLMTLPGCTSSKAPLRVDRDEPAPWAPAAEAQATDRAERPRRLEDERLADADARPWAPRPAPVARRPQPDRERPAEHDEELGPRKRFHEPEPAAPAGFVDAAEDARSTFGVDIDTASYTLIRNHLARGLLPPAGAVRVEEVVNALDAGLAGPAGDAGFAVHLEGAPSPFGPPGSWLVRLGLRARDVSRAERRPATVVLCLDTSGSMGEEGKLALVQASLRRLVRALRPDDEVAIVTFDTDAEVALDPTSVDDADEIEEAIDDLRPDGATNVDAGLKLAYDVALSARWPRGARGGLRGDRRAHRPGRPVHRRDRQHWPHAGRRDPGPGPRPTSPRGSPSPRSASGSRATGTRSSRSSPTRATATTATSTAWRRPGACSSRS